MVQYGNDRKGLRTPSHCVHLGYQSKRSPHVPVPESLCIGHSLCVCGYAGSRLTLTVEFMHGHGIRSRGVLSQLNPLSDDTAVQSLTIEGRNSWPAD